VNFTEVHDAFKGERTSRLTRPTDLASGVTMSYLAPFLTAAPTVHAAAPRAAAQPTDGVSTWFVFLAVGALVIVAARWLGGGEGLGASLATVGSVLTAVIVVTALAMAVYTVLLVLGVVGIGA
jgi:hypothetical protein